MYLYICKVTALCHDTLGNTPKISVRTFRHRPAWGMWPEAKLELIQRFEEHFDAKSGLEMIVLDVEMLERIEI